MFSIEYYTLPDGHRPVNEFLMGLSVKMRVKAVNSLELLEQYGNQLREPYSKAMGDGIFELRVQFSSDITRFFYFFYAGNKIIVTNGFIKKSQRTPPAELEKAKRYKQDYERRHPHE